MVDIFMYAGKLDYILIWFYSFHLMAYHEHISTLIDALSHHFKGCRMSLHMDGAEFI